MTADKYGGEKILVVPTLLFHELGYFQGFNPETRPYLKTLLDGSKTYFLPRVEAEDDPSHKQLIPYCLFRCGDRILNYRRGSGIGESRLLGKRSVGIGGHVSEADAAGADHPYQAGMRREIEEEVEIGSVYRESIIGLINDDQTPVGKVHLGVVHLFELESPRVEARETGIAEARFSRLGDLLAARDEFETWSQLCLTALASVPA